MRLQKFGHSCVLVEDGGVRVLLDPGSFSSGFESLTGLAAVLVTHQHADHLDTERLGSLLGANPGAQLVADSGSAAQLREAGYDVTEVHAGDELAPGGLPVAVEGSDHAVIHADLPVVANVGYRIAGRFFYPGDAFTLPAAPVDVLALPTAAPWLKLAEAVDYLRAVGPRVAVPVHEAVLAVPRMHYDRFADLGGGAEVRVIDDGEPVEV